ncbi:hypothetical protein MRB53_037425 [Persea americana]|nr:hypothetical protein MRB53_037425 [Persea americana]
MMGYADPKQLGTGLRQRLYSRAFIVGEIGEPAQRIAYLVLDTQSGDTAVRHGILRRLKSLGPEYAMYTKDNVAITGTHSHSGPGAWLNYLLPQVTSKGFNKQSYEAIVEGAVASIQAAHRSLARGRLSVGTIEILDANINRSPFAYLANPAEERKRYKYDVDKDMTLLRFKRSFDGKIIGALNWFPVHGTSMLGNNTLITGDNKGVAAYLLEREMGNGFVAGFSQANVGDTSPNVLGAYCEDGSGEQCDFQTSLCGGRNEPCHGRGPFFGLDDGGTKSCFEIGKRQFERAKRLLDKLSSGKSKTISGPVRSFHTFANMSNFQFPHPNGSIVQTCPAALGYSFAAGTTDGPGAFDFKQNNSGNPDASPVWAAVSRFIHNPSDEQRACHAPKPILLDVGETTSPYLWTPNVVDIQLMRIGPLLIIVAPGEATTMSGRRWKAALAEAGKDVGLGATSDEELMVVLGGPANTYAHYIATEEEYAVQRYEGASTLYGQYTLNAYIHITTNLLQYLSTSSPDVPLDPGPSPPIHVNNSLSFITPVVFDGRGLAHSIGDVLEDVGTRMYQGGESVLVRFQGANPRNDLRLGGTYAAVKKLDEVQKRFVTYLTDADWELVFEWRRVNSVAATSEVTITWEIPEDVEPGSYRLEYYGTKKNFGSGKLEEFVGVSGIFDVV